MSDEHLVDGALSHASACLGLALVLAEPVWGCSSRAIAGAGALALLGGVTWQSILGAAEIADDADPTGLFDVARSTTFGRSATGAVLASCAFVVMLAVLRRRRTRVAGVVAALGGFGVAMMLSLTGHAAPAGRPSPQVVAHAVHLSASAAWLGGLVALAEASAGGLVQPARILRVSRGALLLAALAVVSGAVRCTDHLGSCADLFTDYGRVLLAKVGFVAAVLAIAARHRGRTLPRVREGLVPSGFARDLGAEIVAAVTAVLLAAALAQLEPPR